jgi:hypothetical protein
MAVLYQLSYVGAGDKSYPVSQDQQLGEPARMLDLLKH